MQIWIKQGKTALRLPILPAEIQEAEEMNNTTVNIDGLGEVTLLGKKKLATLPLSAHFPKNAAYYDNYSGYPSPANCVDKVQKMKNNGVCQLIITDLGKGINRYITIEKFDWKEQDGTGDIYYTIETKEYVYPGGKRSTKDKESKRYKVKKGDTWAKIAKKFLGSSKKSVITKLKKINNMTKKKKPPTGKTLVIKK